MRLFIVADTRLAIPASIIHDKIMDLIAVCQVNSELDILIVGTAFPASFTEKCTKYKAVSIVTEKVAANLVKQDNNASLLHFGTNTNWAKSLPKYFLPLGMPTNLQHLSFLGAYLLKRQYEKWLQNAKQVLCINDWIYAGLNLHYPKYNKAFLSITIPSIPLPNFEWRELSAAKENLTNGHHYFLAFAPVERVTAILKEFSIFKKWQQTTMHLVFVFDTQKEVDAALLQLKGYKFKQDIAIYLADELCVEWIAATYAILWESVGFSKTVWMEYAILYDIPLLFDRQNELPESWLKAGEVFSFKEQQALSNHFKLYYKDEVYRQARARMGKDWLVKMEASRTPLAVFNNIVLSHNK